ncbi:unnamed protein product, partial [Hymenolepis diminuta]
MKAFILLLTVINCAISDIPSQDERNELLECHNRKRASVQPTSSNMLKLQYSKELEGRAGFWASRCKVTYPNVKKYPECAKFGINMAIYAGNSSNFKDIVEYWWSEVINYNFVNNTCATSKSCANYLQLVCAETSELGCAKQRCDGILPMTKQPTFLFVCLYSRRTYRRERPYKHGPSCSDCPLNTVCTNNLCSTSKRDVEFEGVACASFPNSSTLSLKFSYTVMFLSTLLNKISLNFCFIVFSINSCPK